MAKINENAIPGMYHIADNPALFEPQRTNNFELQIMGLENLIPAEATELDADTRNILNGQEIVRLSVDSASVPSFSQEPIEVHYGNNKLKFAGKPNFKDQSLTVIDYIGADPKAVLLAWQKQSYDVMTQKVGLAKDYKKTTYLVEYTPNYEVVRTWEIRGCWISDLSFDDFQMNQSGRKSINCTISYDYAFISD